MGQKKRNRWINFWFVLAVVFLPLVACQGDDIVGEGDETEPVCVEYEENNGSHQYSTTIHYSMHNHYVCGNFV